MSLFFPRRFLIVILNKIVSSLSLSVALSLEWRIQKVLGKGFGSSSLRQEIEFLQLFSEKIELSYITCLDVGANKGQYGLEFKKKFPAATIHSFEPSKMAFLNLKKNAKDFDNWNVHNFGFGSKNSEEKLFFDMPGNETSSLIKQVEIYGESDSKNYELVKIITIKEFLDSNPHIQPNVLKLDVEGYELQCLLGAEKYITKFKLIQFEFGEINIDSRTYFKDYWNYFSSMGFIIYRVTTKKPLLIEKYCESLETFAVTNYIAVKL